MHAEDSFVSLTTTQVNARNSICYWYRGRKANARCCRCLLCRRWLQFKWTPLHEAAYQGHTDVIEVLLAAKAKVSLECMLVSVAMRHACSALSHRWHANERNMFHAPLRCCHAGCRTLVEPCGKLRKVVKNRRSSRCWRARMLKTS